MLGFFQTERDAGRSRSLAGACLGIGIFLGLGISRGSEKSIPAATLQWHNGDQLKGKILPGSPKRLVWKCDVFSDPFRIDTNQLRSLTFPDSYLGKTQESPGPFRISFCNGDRLYGRLIAIHGDFLTFKCPRIAEPFVVDRKFIHRVERVSGSHLRYSGPVELDSWKPLGRHATEKDWYVKKTGEFVTHRWGGELFRSIPLPRKTEISFTLICPCGKPNFEAGVTEDPNTGPRIETWDDTLVLSSDNLFAPIMVIDKEIHQLDLRLFWDQDAREVRVCDVDGAVLARLNSVSYQVEDQSKTSPRKRRTSSNSRDPKRCGFRLLNRNPELGLARLSVREWDGKTIPRFDASKPRLEVSSGEVVFDLNGMTLSPDAGFRVRGRFLPLENVDQLVFSAEKWLAHDAGNSRISWHDGGIVSGKSNVLDHRQVQISPAWYGGQFTAELKGAKELYFPEPRGVVVSGSDRIKSGDIDTSGFLTPGENGSPNTLLTWRPPGSENASPLAENRSAEVTREAYPGATEMVGEARLYLTNDEVIAGKLIAVKEKKIEFVSYITGRITVPDDKVRALDIEGAELMANGFADKGWIILPGEQNRDGLFLSETKPDAKEEPGVVLEAEKATLQRGGFGHMNLLVGDRIRFRTKWGSNYGVFTMRLFCSDLSKEAPSTDILIGAQGNRILVGQLKPGGGFTFSGEQITIKDQQADIEVLARHDQVEVSVNNKKSLTMAVKPNQVSGNGVIFKMGGGWQGWNDNPNAVEFTEFSVDRSSGYLPKRIINQEAKVQALTIPRFHRENPPTQVLVAPNGDLLRGRLQSVRGDQIEFVTRNEEVILPRSRVSAIVWLRPDPDLQESKNKEAASQDPPSKSGSGKKEFKATHQFILHDGTRLNLSAADSDSKEVFAGYSSVLGLCKVPLSRMSKINWGPAYRLARAATTDQLAYSDWIMKLTPDPAIPKGDGSETSPMVGKAAPNLTLSLLEGGEFVLSKQKGKVVVLDFWATWCGPCIRAMPDVFRAVGLFRNRPVDFVAVNQAETPPIINQFLEARGWTGTRVGLDFDLSAGKDYQVKGIPHTVVIGKDGKIAWVHAGYAPDLGKKLAQAIAAALAK